MISVQQISEFLEAFAPASLAEDWDNVGLLVGDRRRTVERVMTCLTITPASASEAVREKVQLIVTHHPLPFQPLKRLTTDTTPGRLLWDLIRAGVSVYSPHTAFDSALEGINHRWAVRLELRDPQPLVPQPRPSSTGSQHNPGTGGQWDAGVAAGLGAGRWGTLSPARSLDELVADVKKSLGLTLVAVVGDPGASISKLAVACGSAGQFLAPARRVGCQMLLTGETNFHTCLEAEATGMSLVLTGHYASERFAVEELATVLGTQFPTLTIWPSRDEKDPVMWR